MKMRMEDGCWLGIRLGKGKAVKPLRCKVCECEPRFQEMKDSRILEVSIKEQSKRGEYEDHSIAGGEEIT